MPGSRTLDPSVTTILEFFRRCRVWLEILILPLLSVMLPWRVAFRCYRYLARQDWLLRDATERAAATAIAYGYLAVDDPGAVTVWRRDFRLILLVDHADAFLSRFRSARWLDRHVRPSGDGWPEGAFIGITFHYGAGLWAIRHLRRSGQRSAFLSIRFDAGSFPGEFLRFWLARWRMREVARAGGAPVIYTGGSVARIRAALQEGVSVLGLIDVPTGQTTAPRPVFLLGRPARLPPGLLRIAREAGVPVALFSMGVDTDTGERWLHIHRLDSICEDRGLVAIGEFFDATLRKHPPAWHLWGDLPCFLDSSR